MHTDANHDVLGDEGRQILDACVKVKIIGKPQNTVKYRTDDAIFRFRKCYAGRFPQGVRHYRQPTIEGDTTAPAWLEIKDPENLAKYDENSLLTREEFFDIIDIHNALVEYDQMLYVEKYSNSGPGSDELKKLIDKRRADIERECEKAIADPDARHKYSWLVAQRRVRDCYAGNFAGDRAVLRIVGTSANKDGCNIFQIRDAVTHCSEEEALQKFPEDEGPGCNELKELIQAHSSGVENEYQEAKRRLPRYSHSAAEKKVRDLFQGFLPQNEDIFPIKEGENGEQNYVNQTYDSFDIHEKVLEIDRKLSPNIKANFQACRMEREKVTSGLHTYSRSEAERRVRDCFAGPFLHDTDIFPNKETEKSGIPKSQQTYDIFEIKKAVDHFDMKKLLEKRDGEKDSESKKENQKVDEERAQIKEEYKEATARIEIEHGSGFIVNDHFIITNKHVIEDVGDKEIYISNTAIGELPCEIAYTDAGKDLALLYCRELNLNQNGIFPLQLSNQSLLPGMQVFSFGYPMSHTGETALFVNGYVSGSKETYSGHNMIVLNCPLNSGCSGGPVFIWGQLKVVGVATQKHFKEILTLDEREKIEKIRESFQTSSISSFPDNAVKDTLFRQGSFYFPRPEPCQTPMFLLTLKLYDALETHSQFNLGNALPGHCVIEFIQEMFSKYKGEGKEELVEILKWSQDHANILPSGHHSASDCCIQ